MNTIVALLTAASVLVHAALGCCIHHAHGSPTACAEHQIFVHQHFDELGHSACTGHRHDDSGDDGPSPARPPENCRVGVCSAIAARAPTTLLEAGVYGFEAAPHTPAGRTPDRPSLHDGYCSLQHDLGPPLRPHLWNLVLLI